MPILKELRTFVKNMILEGFSDKIKYSGKGNRV